MHQLLRLDEIELSEYRVLARHSFLWPLFMGIVFWLPLPVLLILRLEGLPGMIYFSTLFLLFASYFPFKQFSLSRDKKTNWLLAVNKTHLLCKFRSHLNKHFPASDPQVLAIPLTTISAFQKVSLKRSVMTHSGGSQTHFLTFLDIHLGANLPEIREALARERKAKVKGKTNYGHHSVSVTETGIRIHWRAITSSIAKMHRKSELTMPLDTSEKEMEEYLRKRIREQSVTEDELLRLIEQGDSSSAVQIVRDSYGMTFSEARQFVDELG